eukprot:scaffold2664_cov117-Isochrysis_galbana.AAC.1
MKIRGCGGWLGLVLYRGPEWRYRGGPRHGVGRWGGVGEVRAVGRRALWVRWRDFFQALRMVPASSGAGVSQGFLHSLYEVPQQLAAVG